MSVNSTWKLVQKKVYDILSHRYGTIAVICGCILVVVSAFQFGEVALEWSKEKYAAVFNSFSDNVAGRSFRERLCLPVPIDVVYTWVNGSDPRLLWELRRLKTHMEVQINETSSDDCMFTHCVRANMIAVEPALSPQISIERLAILYPAFTSAVRTFHVKSPLGNKNNVTIVVFENAEDVTGALDTELMIDGKKASVKKTYYTTDWTLQNSVLLSDTIMMTGFPHTYTKEQIKEKLPAKYKHSVSQISLFAESGLAVMEVPKRTDFDELLKGANFTIEGKDPTLISGNLVWDLQDYSMREDISANRFEDNEELRYSIRSIERYAPWVRHIYIVTNGQIPGWLNLDSPRLTLVTHDEIFSNKSHLPTFSSPAIESHLHRIPGLSDQFIYMNDDVMFGKEIWPDDFYTHARGQKMYLTWPVPSCQDGCPSNWIKDGFCDKACNNSDCEFDGGDCAGGAQANSWSMGGWGGKASDSNYCNSGCANNWISDRYCDQACNVIECGFDAGDCGTDHYSHVFEIKYEANKTHYKVPKGRTSFFINVTALFGVNGQAVSGDYGDTDLIRNGAIAQKFGVITIVMQANQNATTLDLSVTGKRGAEEAVKQMNLTIDVDTHVIHKSVNETKEEVQEGNKLGNDTKETVQNATAKPPFVFKDYPAEQQSAKALAINKETVPLVATGNLSDYEIPEDLNSEYDEIISDLKEGDLTKKGYEEVMSLLWLRYQNWLKEEGKQPQKRKPKPEHPADQDPEQKMDSIEIKQKQEENKHNEEEQQVAEKKIAVQEQQSNQNVDPLNVEDVAVPKLQKEEIENADRDEAAVDKSNEVMNKPMEEEGAADGDIHKSRKLNSLDGEGFLPWEKEGVFKELQEKKEALEAYQPAPVRIRKLQDTFGDSLRHVNRLYNKVYGYEARKVPAHMAHFINKNIAEEIQSRFSEEWETTSSHQVRSSTDMQYAFSYMYYIMHEPQPRTDESMFAEMDMDNSGVWSDREIRTLATRLYDLPLDLPTLTGLETMITNCSKHLPPDQTATYMEPEKYYDTNMPQVTKYLVLSCGPLVELLRKKFPTKTKYKYEMMNDDEIAFKMIHTNVSQVVGQLDDIRKRPKKFICLNDNIDHKSEESKTTKAVIQDFYEALLPIPSSFELPRDYRNRFLHIDDLREWRKYRDWLRLWTQVALGLLVLFTVTSFFSDKIEAFKKRYTNRRGGGGDGNGKAGNTQSPLLSV